MTAGVSSPITVKGIEVSMKVPIETEAALLTGGFDRPYAFGLTMALAAKNIRLDVIGSDEVDSSEMHATPHVNFLNLQGSMRSTGLLTKISNVLKYYARLFRYTATARPKIFHILWNNKFQYFDRTLLLLYYKLLGKKLLLTVHNVNAGKRDDNDSFLNRLTLKIQYRTVDHLFVHTEKMKGELLQDFGIKAKAVSVIPFGINNSVPDTELTPALAKQHLGIKDGEKVMLFFGAIRPYKGLEYLVNAFLKLAEKDSKYRLIIAGEPKKDCEKYIGDIQQVISDSPHGSRVIQKTEHVPDEETELYFKAADVLVLPYTHVFQSGVLFLGYSFGLPVVAADVGSLKEEIIEGQTGFSCKPCDSEELAKAIKKYFESDLFLHLNQKKQEIKDYANAQHSWDVVGEITRDVYAKLLGERQ